MVGIRFSIRTKRLCLLLLKRMEQPPMSSSRFETISHQEMELFFENVCAQKHECCCELQRTFWIFSHLVIHCWQISSRNYKYDKLWQCKVSESIIKLMPVFSWKSTKNWTFLFSKSIIQSLTSLQNYALTQDSEFILFTNQRKIFLSKSLMALYLSVPIPDLVDNFSRQLREGGVGLWKLQAWTETVWRLSRTRNFLYSN